MSDPRVEPEITLEDGTSPNQSISDDHLEHQHSDVLQLRKSMLQDGVQKFRSFQQQLQDDLDNSNSDSSSSSDNQMEKHGFGLMPREPHGDRSGSKGLSS